MMIFVYRFSLVGGFKHFFPFHIWDVILPIWRTPSFFKMGTLHHQAVHSCPQNLFTPVTGHAHCSQQESHGSLHRHGVSGSILSAIQQRWEKVDLNLLRTIKSGDVNHQRSWFLSGLKRDLTYLTIKNGDSKWILSDPSKILAGF